MAYSDYGGYAYRNGTRVNKRSDYTIRPDGSGFGTPGMYPGFALIAAGASKEEVQKQISYPHHHVVLGDGPIMVGMHKQSTIRLYRNGEPLELVDYVQSKDQSAIKHWEYGGGSGRYVDNEHFIAQRKPCVFEIDGCKLTVHWTEEDNYYQYAELVQPDGTIWHGWSGYGVGAGLEDAGYGYSTVEREEMLDTFFPGRIE